MLTDEEVLGFTAKSNVTDLIPADVFSAFVLEAIYSTRQLAGVVSATREDITGQAGDTVQVPKFTARVAQGPITEGSALTATAQTGTSTVSIALSKYGDYDLVNNEVWEDQTIFTEAALVANMAEGLAEKLDDLVYTEAEGAAAGSSKTLAVAGTLTDLYDKVVECRAAMRKLKVKPNTAIGGPDQSAQFLKDTDEGIKETQINVQAGMVLMVAGLEWIETPLANANAATAGMVQVIILDTRRALGEAWGRRPERKIDRDSKSESDQTKVVMWLRYGTADLDVNAIGHVKNP